MFVKTHNFQVLCYTAIEKEYIRFLYVLPEEITMATLVECQEP